MRIEFDEQCKPCNGSGLYKGMAERDGYAVVCQNCGGTGKHHFVYEYEEFTGRKDRDDITNVIQCNPGIAVGGKQVFGGISYEQWKSGGTFPPKSEMRNFTCPCWWYQYADYRKRPNWDECIICGIFSNCKHYPNKEKCWERWDRENSQ